MMAEVCLRGLQSAAGRESGWRCVQETLHRRTYSRQVSPGTRQNCHSSTKPTLSRPFVQREDAPALGSRVRLAKLSAAMSGLPVLGAEFQIAEEPSSEQSSEGQRAQKSKAPAAVAPRLSPEVEDHLRAMLSERDSALALVEAKKVEAQKRLQEMSADYSAQFDRRAMLMLSVLSDGLLLLAAAVQPRFSPFKVPVKSRQPKRSPFSLTNNRMCFFAPRMKSVLEQYYEHHCKEVSLLDEKARYASTFLLLFAIRSAADTTTRSCYCCCASGRLAVDRRSALCFARSSIAPASLRAAQLHFV